MPFALFALAVGVAIIASGPRPGVREAPPEASSPAPAAAPRLGPTAEALARGAARIAAVAPAPQSPAPAPVVAAGPAPADAACEARRRFDGECAAGVVRDAVGAPGPAPVVAAPPIGRRGPPPPPVSLSPSRPVTPATPAPPSPAAAATTAAWNPLASANGLRLAAAIESIRGIQDYCLRSVRMAMIAAGLVSPDWEPGDSAFMFGWGRRSDNSYGGAFDRNVGGIRDRMREIPVRNGSELLSAWPLPPGAVLNYSPGTIGFNRIHGHIEIVRAVPVPTLPGCDPRGAAQAVCQAAPVRHFRNQDRRFTSIRAAVNVRGLRLFVPI